MKDEIDYGKVIEATRWCNMLLYGSTMYSNWYASKSARTWLDNDEEESPKQYSLLPMFFYDLNDSIPVTMIKLPEDIFQRINIIFHGGMFPVETIRMFFFLYYNALARSPKKYFENKTMIDYKSFFKRSIKFKMKKIPTLTMVIYQEHCRCGVNNI
jgi:hypothetical protein